MHGSLLLALSVVHPLQLVALSTWTSPQILRQQPHIVYPTRYKGSLCHVRRCPVNLSANDEQESLPTKQPRRQRYSGKYPRNFSEKYKEHQGNSQVIEKVLAKGMTPAGTHVPIMLRECLQYLGLEDPDSKSPHLVIDCTLGYGGHSSHILRALGDGRLIAFDRDPVEIRKTQARLQEELKANQQPDSLLTTVNQNFETLGPYLLSCGQMGCVTSLLADLGLSSMQIDDNTRGFTYKREGPLDMRMSTTDSETAYDLLSRLKPRELKKILDENSDEVFASEIALGLLGKKGANNIPETTIELAEKVRDIVRPLIEHQTTINGARKPNVKKQLDSTVARVMQAVRIEVNGEFRALERLLEDLPDILAPGGKAVFLTFHSGEDRRVKKAFKSGYKSGIYSSWSRNVVRPTGAERRNNPRSSCCKLRWVIRA